MQNQINGMTARIDKLEKAVTRIEIWVIGGAVISVLMRCLPLQQPQPPSPAPQHSGNSHVQIATSPESLAESESRREYFTVEEVARREGLADRTIISAIEQGRIIPAPNRTGRAWQISRDYRYQPPTTADSR